MSAPNLTPEDVRRFFGDLSDVGPAFPRSGQKQVFPCLRNHESFVLKFLIPNISDEEATDPASIRADSVYARAHREVQVMRACNSPHIPKVGPIDLQIVFQGERGLICFSEELIDGSDLKVILQKHRTLNEKELIELALQINEAIRHLWANQKIHRDIKPGNIMKRNGTGEFVLLDAGLAFDLGDDSLTDTGFVPGTPGYLAPEQIDPYSKRQTDNRADMFLLGIVLYECATGTHPFIPRPQTNRREIVDNVRTLTPPTPKSQRNELSDQFSDLVMRLLSKRPHMRFKNNDHLESALKNI